MPRDLIQRGLAGKLLAGMLTREALPGFLLALLTHSAPDVPPQLLEDIEQWPVAVPDTAHASLA